MHTANERSREMSVSKWAYDPDVCDGKRCPGDCDFCYRWRKKLEEESDEEDKEYEQEMEEERRGYK